MKLSPHHYHHSSPTHGIPSTLQPLDTTIIITITPLSPTNDITNNATNTISIPNPSRTNDTSAQNYDDTTITKPHPPIASLTDNTTTN